MVKLASAILAVALMVTPAIGRAGDAATALDVTVEQAWMADRSIPAYLIAAQVRDGKLQLFGSVETKAQRAAALKTAKQLAGKTPVVNHIQIAKIASQLGTDTGAGPSAVPPQDEAMAVSSTVEQAWMADGKIPYYLIAAKVRKGNLELFGAVENSAQHDAAVAIAKQNAGSLHVVDHIAVTKIASQSPAPKKKPS